MGVPIETQIRKLREEVRREMQEMRKLIMGRNIVGNWVMQPMACAMINVKPRQLRNLRVHLDDNGKQVGCIRWRKGAGRTVQYHKADLEKYLDQITIS